MSGNAGTQTISGLSPRLRRELAEDAAEWAETLASAGFAEDAETLGALVKRVAAGMVLREVTVGATVVVDDLYGPDLVFHLLERDERDGAWLARRLPSPRPAMPHMSTSQVNRLIRGEQPITERVARELSNVWPEFEWTRFVTSAAAARRAS